MTSPTSRWLGRALGAVAIGCVVVAAVLAGQDQQWSNFLDWAPSAIAFSLVGIVLVVRVPSNAVSWLTLTFGVVMATELVTLVISEHADSAADINAFTEWTAWARLVGIDLLLVVLIPLILVFPDGHLPSRGWAAVVWLTGLQGGLATLVAATTSANWHNVTGGQRPNYEQLDVPFTPLSLPGGAQQWYDAFTNLLPILLLAALVGLTWRYRRSTQIVRAQIKWVVAAAAVMVIVTLVTTSILPVIWSDLDATVGPMLTLPLIPVAIGIAVLRLRLYDIDRAISRTLSYAIVTAVLIGVYAAVVVSASRLLHTKSPVVVAAATLAAAAVAQPLLRRVRAMVDRRFDRIRYDQLRTVDNFGSALSQQVQTDEVSRRLVATVHGTLQPVTAGLWLRDAS